MIDTTGHLAIGLLFVLPAWWVLDDRASVGFVALAAVAGLFPDVGLLRRQVTRWIGERVDPRRLSVAAAITVLAGTLSHLVADTLSAADSSTPIEPFWPFSTRPWSVDRDWYDAAWINYGFLAVMATVHVVVASLTTPAPRRQRLDPL